LQIKKIMDTKKITAAAFISGFLLLTGCSDDLPEDELVQNGQAFEMQQVGDDLQASNFPDESSLRTDGKTFTLEELEGEVKDLMGDNYWPQMDMTEEELEKEAGITEDMYIDCLARKQSMDAHIDTMIIVHAREEYVGAVEQALENYRSSIIEENKEYPQNLGKAEASRMETIEDYVCFVQLGADTTVVADQGEDAVIDYCLEENERAIDALEKAILE
jgi:tetratricopeptide (TPR) repeat protein